MLELLLLSPTRSYSDRRSAEPPVAPIAESGTWTWRSEEDRTLGRCDARQREAQSGARCQIEGEEDNDGLAKTIRLPCLCLASMRRVSTSRRVGESDAAKIESRNGIYGLTALRGLTQCSLDGE